MCAEIAWLGSTIHDVLGGGVLDVRTLVGQATQAANIHALAQDLDGIVVLVVPLFSAGRRGAGRSPISAIATARACQRRGTIFKEVYGPYGSGTGTGCARARECPAFRNASGTAFPPPFLAHVRSVLVSICALVRL